MSTVITKKKCNINKETHTTTSRDKNSAPRNTICLEKMLQNWGWFPQIPRR